MGKFRLTGARVLGRRTARMAAVAVVVLAGSLGVLAGTTHQAFADTAPVITASSTTGDSTPTPDSTPTDAGTPTDNGTPTDGSTPPGSTPTVDPTPTPTPTDTDTTQSDIAPADVTPADTAPVFTADSPPLTVVSGTEYDYTFQATGSPTPTYSWGSLGGQSFLSINPTTGEVSGVVPGYVLGFGYSVTATNSAGSLETTYYFVNVTPSPNAPVFTQQSPPTYVTAGSAYDYTFAATGTPAPTFSLATGAPSWLSINSATGEVSGTVPTGITSFYYTVYADNSAGEAQTSAFVSVAAANQLPFFTADTPPTTATPGSDYSYQFSAIGPPAPTFSLAPGAPSWLSIDSTTGALSGTLPADATTFSYTVNAVNAAGVTSESYTVTVAPPAQAPAFTAESAPTTAIAGSVYSYTFAASGTPAPTFSLASGAPAWLSIDATSGALSGTVPSGITSFAYTVVASNSAGSKTASYIVTVSGAAPVFTADTPPDTVAAGSDYSYTFAASGNPAPTFSLSGSPSWLSVDSATGAVSGTVPSDITSFVYSVIAANSDGSVARTFEVTVTGGTTPPATQAPAFTADSPSLTAAPGSDYSYTFAASGTPAPAFSLSSSALWLSVDTATGAVSGTVPAETASFSYTVTAANSAGSVSKTFTVRVSSGTTPPPPPSHQPPPTHRRLLPQVIHFATPHAGAVGTRAVLSAAGGGSGNPVRFAVDRSSGRGVCRVSGRTVWYLADGTCVIDASQAGNARYAAAAPVKAATVSGTAPRFVAASPVKKAAAGSVYSAKFAAVGYPAPTYALVGAPSWLKINSRTGVVSGTVPAGTKAFSYKVEAVNAVGKVITGHFTVLVVIAPGRRP